MLQQSDDQVTPSRLGFAVKVLGQPGLKSHDSRRWQSEPHLRVSLEYLDQLFDYLDAHHLSMYRITSDLAPYATHPAMPQFHGMVDECAADLRAIGAKARQLNLRLSMHPSQYIVLNSPDPALVRTSMADVSLQADLLDRMEQGPEAVVVIHVGGTYGDRHASRARWVDTWHVLPAHVRHRLVLEHDDLRFSAADVLWIHEHTGVRLIFDHQHFWCFNPEALALADTARRLLATWQGSGARPKVHFSSPRTEMRELQRTNRRTGKKETVQVAPIWSGHADFCHPFEFITFMRSLPDVEFDVMLESKAKDLAVIRLRPDLLRFAPDVAARFGLQPQALATMEAEEASVLVTESGEGAA